MTDDPHAPKVSSLRERLLRGSGKLDSSIRVAAAEGGTLPAELENYVKKLTDHSYDITDADIDDLRRSGYTEDQIFELTLSGALGAGLHRIRLGLSALEAGRDAPADSR